MSSFSVENNSRCRDDSDDELRVERSEARLDEHARARDDQYVWLSAPSLEAAIQFFLP